CCSSRGSPTASAYGSMPGPATCLKRRLPGPTVGAACRCRRSNPANRRSASDERDSLVRQFAARGRGQLLALRRALDQPHCGRPGHPRDDLLGHLPALGTTAHLAADAAARGGAGGLATGACETDLDRGEATG